MRSATRRVAASLPPHPDAWNDARTHAGISEMQCLPTSEYAAAPRRLACVLASGIHRRPAQRSARAASRSRGERDDARGAHRPAGEDPMCLSRDQGAVPRLERALGGLSATPRRWR